MRRSYYYFVASLPIVEWDGKPPMSTEEFLSAAQRLSSKEDYALIEQLLGSDDPSIPTDNEAARSWMKHNRIFRNELASLRAHHAHKDPAKFTRGLKENEAALREIIYEASKIPNLLEGEKTLDRIHWQFLDDLGRGHYFDIEFLIVYGLKLRILNRHQEFRSSKGNDAFNQIKAMELPVSRSN